MKSFQGRTPFGHIVAIALLAMLLFLQEATANECQDCLDQGCVFCVPDDSFDPGEDSFCECGATPCDDYFISADTLTFSSECPFNDEDISFSFLFPVLFGTIFILCFLCSILTSCLCPKQGNTGGATTRLGLGAVMGGVAGYHIGQQQQQQMQAAAMMNQQQMQGQMPAGGMMYPGMQGQMPAGGMIYQGAQVQMLPGRVMAPETAYQAPGFQGQPDPASAQYGQTAPFAGAVTTNDLDEGKSEIPPAKFVLR